MTTVQPFAASHCETACRSVALRDEARAGRFCGNVVVLGVRERLDVLRAGFDRGRFDVGAGVGVMRFHEADVIEEKLVAARRAELAALEEDANLGRGAVFVVGQNFDDDRHLVRRVAFEDDVLEREFFGRRCRRLS